MEDLTTSLEKKILTALEEAPGDGLTFYGDQFQPYASAPSLEDITEIDELRESDAEMQILSFQAGVGLGYSMAINAYRLPTYTAYFIDTDDDGTHLLAMARGYSDEDALAVIHHTVGDWLDDADNFDEESEEDWFAEAEEYGGFTCLETDDALVLWIAAGMPPPPRDEDGTIYLFDSSAQWEAYIEERVPDQE